MLSPLVLRSFRAQRLERSRTKESFDLESKLFTRKNTSVVVETWVNTWCSVSNHPGRCLLMNMHTIAEPFYNVNYGTIHLTCWQIFTIPYPLPSATIGIPAHPPLRPANVLNGWSLWIVNYYIKKLCFYCLQGQNRN